MDRVKAIHRPSAAVEQEAYRPELTGDEEPRYLRRQRPVEIRRKKFGGRNWMFYRRVMILSVAGIAGVTAAIVGTRFLLYSPKVLLLKPEQIEVTGNRIVNREAIRQQFARDRNRSVLSVPLDKRRSELEQLSWVESATVQRILPNRIHVEVVERTPVAFLRNGRELALIDAHGVILDRPRDEDLHFPVVTGISEDLPRDQREKRMQSYQEFLKDVDLVRAASSDRVSEVDLSNPKDLRVVMNGLSGANDTQTVAIHFGSGDFTGKYRMLVENFSQWQANSGRVLSLDLQYARQVIVNPDVNSSTMAARRK